MILDTSVNLKTGSGMSKALRLFTDRVEAEVPERSPEEITAELEEKLRQYLLPETS